MTRDNNNKLKQQSTSNFVKENTLGIPEEILRVHLFKSYGQPAVDAEHDKPSSLTHIDAEPLLKKNFAKMNVKTLVNQPTDPGFYIRKP